MQTVTTESMIGKLQQQLKAQSETYHNAIAKGKTLEEVKPLYLKLKKTLAEIEKLQRNET